jgi:arylsulfatase A-like enzyme
MRRRQFSRTLAGAAVGLWASGTGGCKGPGKRTFRRPNIVYVLADDLGYGDLGCYGQQKIRTPNIDRMASEGLRFTDHYAGSTVCAPSRCSLMTGLHTGHALVRGNYEKGPHGPGAGVPLRPEDQTVAEALKTAGYRTGLFGKWGLGVEGTSGEPNRKGFDESFGYLNQVHAHYQYPDYLLRNGRRVDLSDNAGGKRAKYANDLIADEALRFVRENSRGPFFLYYSPTRPHAELLVPEDSMKPYLGVLSEGKTHLSASDGGSGHYATQRTPHAAFAGMVSRIDSYVGRLLDLLKELGIDNDTIVFFTSDNGPHREGGADPEFFNSSAGLRGIKRDLYEGGIRVPLVARWPGQIQAGGTSAYVSAFWDFFPTACEMAGTTPPSGLDGVSFLPNLLGGKVGRERALYWEFHERPTTAQAVRSGRWKGVRHNPWTALELYDMRTDQAETRDVASEYPDVVARLERYLDSARTPSDLWPLKTDSKLPG